MTDIVLFIQSDDGETRAQRLRVDGALSIGRHYQNTVCLDSDLVSRHHARVELMDDGLRVEDASSNGTMAGEVLLRGEGIDVPYGTPLKVGNYTLQIDPAPVDAPAPLPARKDPRPSRPPSPTLPPPVGQLASPLPVVLPPLPPRAPSRMPPALAHAPALALVSLSGTRAEPLPSPLEEEGEDADPHVLVRREALRVLADEQGIATAQGARQASRREALARPRVVVALRRILDGLAVRMPDGVDCDELAGELADEAAGLGPLERLMSDPDVFAIMVSAPDVVYADTRAGRVRVKARFTDEARVRLAIERLLARASRRRAKADAAAADAPVIDARLDDGTRVNVVSGAVATRGACLTIHKARPRATLEELVARGALSPEVAEFLRACVVGRRGVLVSGGPGAGKTTLLNALCAAIPDDERIVSLETCAELDLTQPHVVSLETRPRGASGAAGLAQELLRNARRMRADRVVVDECSAVEALDLVDAMGSDLRGALTTVHGRSPAEALARMEALMRAGGCELAARLLRERIAAGVHVIVQAGLATDGACAVTRVDELVGVDDDGAFVLHARGPGAVSLPAS